MKYIDVGFDNICVAVAVKPNGEDPAFMAPINNVIHGDEDKKREACLVLHCQARKSKEENELL